MSLAELATARFSSDAHWAPYDCDEGPRRITLHRLGLTSIALACFVVDLDDPEAHASDGVASDTFLNQATSAAKATGAWAYATRRGCRLVWTIPAVTISSPVHVEQWRRAYVDRLLWLYKTTALLGDAACSDVTRLFRVPYATRDGAMLSNPHLAGSADDPGAWPGETIPSGDRLVLLAGLSRISPTWNKAFREALPPKPDDVWKPRERVFPSTEGAVRHAVDRVRTASPGARNRELFAQSAHLAKLVAKGELSRAEVFSALGQAAHLAGLSRSEIAKTVGSGLKRGMT